MIDKLGDEDSDLTSYNSEYISVNSHLQCHNNPLSFTGPKQFNPYPEYYVNIPGVVLHQEFE